jgi:hypothetical protein
VQNEILDEKILNEQKGKQMEIDEGMTLKAWP